MDKLHLVTGYRGEEHITSADQGSFNASFFGGGEYVMEAGNQFEASIMDNNTVRILDGDALMKGRHLRIEPKTYADVTITTGTAGVNRNDLIVFQYSKDTSTDIETPEIVVIKGKETEGTAVDPEYTDGDILGGATFNQMPMYRVKVEGVVLTGIEPLFNVIPTYKTLAEKYAKQFQEACDTYIGLLNILDTMEEVEANTQEGQLAGALSLKELKNTLQSAIETKVTNNFTAGTVPYSNANGHLVSSVVTDKELARLSGVTASVQNQLDAKVPNNFTASRVLASNQSGKAVASAVTVTELGYLGGVTSNIQTQLNNKLAKTGWSASRAVVTNTNGTITVSNTTKEEIDCLDGVTSNIQTQLDNKQAQLDSLNIIASNTVTNSVTNDCIIKVDGKSLSPASFPSCRVLLIAMHSSECAIFMFSSVSTSTFVLKEIANTGSDLTMSLSASGIVRVHRKTETGAVAVTTKVIFLAGY